MDIRIAEASDLDAVYAIYNDPRVARWLGRVPMARDRFQPLFDDLCARPSFSVWVVNGAVAGFHHLSRSTGTEVKTAYLSTIALAPELQGQGLAALALGDLVQELRIDGFRHIELIVDAANDRAVGLYSRLGFVIARTLSRCGQQDGQMTTVADHYMCLTLA
jgi:ribosomal protein S18 acetylase RimI-like enzyme